MTLELLAAIGITLVLLVAARFVWLSGYKRCERDFERWMR